MTRPCAMMMMKTNATVPAAPTIGAASAGNASATIAFTANGSGGSPITSYTATSTPGGFTGSGASSPVTVNGLTNGTAYTFTAHATNAVGNSSESSASNSVTPQLVFDTWNPADKDAGWTLSGSDLIATNNNNTIGIARSSLGISAGKQYWEFYDFVGAQYSMIGICDGAHTLATYVGNKICNYSSNNGNKLIDTATYPGAAYGAAWFFLNTISILEDHDAGTINFWKGGVDQGVLASGLAGTWYAFVSSAGNVGDGGTANFGQNAFVYTPPVGYTVGRY